MSIQTTLSSLGYSEKEIATYVTILELGNATTSDISRRSGVPRTYTYDICRSLVIKGLLKESTQRKKITYFAQDPALLVSQQKEVLAKLEAVLPELNALNNTTGNKPHIFYFEGDEGLKQIHEDALRYKGDAVAFTSPRHVVYMGGRVHGQHVKHRMELGNKVRIIGEHSPEVIALAKKDQTELRETKLLPPSVFHSDIEIGMYGNKVSVVNYKEKFGFIIENKEFASTLKMIFEMIWKGQAFTYREE